MAIFSTCMHSKSLQLCLTFAALWTIDLQAPVSMGFSSKDTRVGCHAHPQGIFQTQGSNPESLRFSALAGKFFTTNATWQDQFCPEAA